MVEIHTTATFDKLYRKLPKNIQKKAVSKTKIFQNDPFTPALQSEKLTPRKYNIWSFRVDLDYRIVFVFLSSEKAEFRFIGHHNKIYDYEIFR